MEDEPSAEIVTQILMHVLSKLFYIFNRFHKNGELLKCCGSFGVVTFFIDLVWQMCYGGKEWERTVLVTIFGFVCSCICHYVTNVILS